MHGKFWTGGTRLLAFSVEFCIITSFQETIAKPFITHLKCNISSRFASSPGNILLAFSIFDPRKAPSVDSEDLSSYGETSTTILLEHYGAEKSAEILHGEIKSIEPIISSDVTTEWTTLHG